MSAEINGFKFDEIGQLIKEPENPTLEALRDTLEQLQAQKEYISASRIQHRINSTVLG